MNFFTPAEVAQNYIATGKSKVSLTIGKMLFLSVFAGVFIALAGVASTTASVSVFQPSLGKLLGACVFPGGLTMVLLTGSELFTGNTLLVIPLFQREITCKAMLRNWLFVYIGNLIGSMLVAAAVVYCHQLSLFDNSVAVSVLSTAAAKCAMPFGQAFVKGILCNFLVCIAVWISFAAKDVIGKIAGLFFPIMFFVVSGFEHSVANMYFISVGIFAKMVPEYAQAAQAAGIDVSGVNWGSFWTSNLIPVTLGNIVGGAVCVGCICWVLYLRKKEK